MIDKIKMILFVLVLGTILSSALIFVNDYTSPLIEKNRVKKLKKTILSAFDYSFDETNLEQIYDENIQVLGEGDSLYYRSENHLVAFPYKGKGFQGEISGILAMDKDLKHISGLAILSQVETPGLGSRIGEQPFLSQFVRKEFKPNLEFTSVGKGKEVNEIDGISGATLSSKAIIRILNDNYNYYKNIIGGEN